MPSLWAIKISFQNRPLSKSGLIGVDWTVHLPVFCMPCLCHETVRAFQAYILDEFLSVMPQRKMHFCLCHFLNDCH